MRTCLSFGPASRRLLPAAFLTMAALVAGQIPGAAAYGIAGSFPARPSTLGAPPWPLAAAGRERVVIRRTEYGIPHILAVSYRGLGYGYGYAFAQDNLCTMAEHVVTLRGERSAYFGPNAGSGDIEAPPSTNLASDIYYRTALSTATLRRLLALPPPLGPTSQVRALVAGYAAGYDRYLHDTGAAHLPDPTCRSAPWVSPITALDVWRDVYDVARMAGTAPGTGRSSAQAGLRAPPSRSRTPTLATCACSTSTWPWTAPIASASSAPRSGPTRAFRGATRSPPMPAARPTSPTPR